MASDRNRAEPLSELLARHSDPDEVPDVLHVSLSMAVEVGPDPTGIIGYLADLGIKVRRLNDLMLINDVADEEELSAHRVAEGVAIAVASQGDWLLFHL